MCGIDNVPDRKEKCIGVMCNEVNQKLNSVYDNDVIGGTKNKIHKMKVSTLRPIEQDQIVILCCRDYQSIKLFFSSLLLRKIICCLPNL